MESQDDDCSKSAVKIRNVHSKHFTETFFGTYIISVLAACHAELWTFPLDLVKTRLQIQGEHGTQKTQYRGMTATTIGIAREEGFFKLWKGIAPAIYRHILYSGSRMILYDKLRTQFGENGKLTLLPAVICGASAGGLAQYIATPAELIKVQSQMEGKRVVMVLEPRFRTTGQALKLIYKRGGIKGLWIGSSPGVIRAACVNIGDLSAYDVAKRYIAAEINLSDGTLLHFLSSVVAGFVGTVMALPADVIKARIMNQPVDDRGRGLKYTGPIDCLHKTVQNEGIFSLYKGFLPLWIRLGPWATIFWVSFEKIRNVLGGSGF